MCHALCLGSGCSNKVPASGGSSVAELCVTILGAASVRSGCQQGGGLLRTLFWVADCQRLSMSSQGGEQRGSKVSCEPHEDSNPVHEESPLITSSNPNDFSNIPPPDMIAWWG